MIVKKIFYSEHFHNTLKKLPSQIQTIASKKIDLFRQNPLHPSLRLHPLKGNLAGLWSISINGSYRVLFERGENGEIVFYSIGKHDIYKNL